MTITGGVRLTNEPCHLEYLGGSTGVPVLVMGVGTDPRVVTELATSVDSTVPLAFQPVGLYVCSSTDLGVMYSACTTRQRTIARAILALGRSDASTAIVQSFGMSELPRLLHVTTDPISNTCGTLLRESVEMLTLTDPVAIELRRGALADDRFDVLVDFLEENDLRGAECCRRLLVASQA